MACINLPALPLQILLRDYPAWRNGPAAVVDRDKPSGVLQWVNEQARARRILPGMRYAAALSLARDLRAGELSPERIHDEVERLTRRLWAFTPGVEPAPDEPGVFWLDASGLQRLYPALSEWAASVYKALRGEGFDLTVAVGFSRFGVYAAAKAQRGTIVFRDAVQERDAVQRTPMERLDLDPALHQMLVKLGVRTLGEFIALPAASVRRRLGAQAYALHRMAQGGEWHPLQARPIPEPAERTADLEYPETHHDRLMAIAAPMMRRLLETLAQRREMLEALHLDLKLDNGPRQQARLAPASPTNDAKQLTLLLRLRLESLALPSGVVELTLRADGIAAGEHQLNLFQHAPQRGLDVAQEAFARIRAEFGEGAVVRARLREGHLPEAGFTWEPLDRLRAPDPAPAAQRVLVRRLYTPPVKLPPRPRHEAGGWLVGGAAEGPV
ncbi:MAG: DNA polymerase Y family protein, partial [Candidatus Hydrogenedentota bacterium]